jgi:tetratricopeptide (TPR) repeat protein
MLVFGGGLFAADDAAEIAAARALYADDRLDAARAAFSQLASSGSQKAEVSFYLGEIALRRNETRAAIAHFEQAVVGAPMVSRYHHRLGDAYGRAAQEASIFTALGWARKCLHAFERAVELAPRNLAARYSLFTFYRGAPALIGGGADKAAAEAAAIEKLDPGLGRIAFAALHVSLKKYDQARAAVAENRPIALSAVKSDHAFLSDVEWSNAAVSWGEPARNHTWFDENSHPGVVLIVHGRLYAKGLYAHSPSHYTFPLGGRWKEFRATVGLREGAPKQGSAVFIVRGDGREIFRSATLRVDSSQRLKIDVSGVDELELVTLPGEAHNHFSWAIWAEPLVRR